jgi:hypothetical protein
MNMTVLAIGTIILIFELVAVNLYMRNHSKGRGKK